MIKDFLYPAKFLSTQLRSSGQTELKNFKIIANVLKILKLDQNLLTLKTFITDFL
jgi:hypothetical protein